jgi:hypothetical protein
MAPTASAEEDQYPHCLVVYVDPANPHTDLDCLFPLPPPLDTIHDTIDWATKQVP